MEDARIWNADAEAIRLVECGKYRILSLDVFDTTVWRTFPAPTDLFYALGEQLKSQGRLFSSASPASFSSERIEAEREARSKTGTNSEVTLEEIYENFPRGLLRSGTVRDVMAAELALERQSTHPDLEIAALIDRAVTRGLQIAFVSDTYFDESHFRAILPREYRFLLTSCAFRRSKSQGLHSELSRRSGVQLDQILHVGDNLEADVKAPARLGVTTLWRPRFPQSYADALGIELPTSRSERSALFTEGGDGGLYAIRAQSVTDSDNWPDALRSWGSLFLGPLMGGFGKWVGERCKTEEISTAFCLMREGRILKTVLNHCAPELQAHEFFTSRYAMIRSSIFTGKVSELTQYLVRQQPTSALELLEPLGIEPVEAGLSPEILVSASSAQELAERIANRPSLRRKAQQASAESRTAFLRYLKNAFSEIPDRVALVDLGYSGTIQNHLQAIFDHEGIHCKTHGLYFVTGSGIRRIQSKGIVAEGFMGDNGQPLSIAHSFMRSPELVEQCLMCPIGSTMGYDENGRPILGDQHLPDAQLEEIGRVQAGMLDFTTRFNQTPSMQARRSEEIRPFLEAILIRCLTRPTPLELNIFGSWVHDENLGSSRTRSLIEAGLDPDYLSHATAHQLASLSNATSYWIFGTAQAQHPMVGEAVRSIFLRRTTPEAFQCPEEGRKMHFFWNDGTAHRAESAYKLSSKRTAWSRFTIDVRRSDLLEVGFSMGTPGDVISISGLVLRVHQAGLPVAVIRLPLNELETFGMERLKNTSSTFLVTELAGFAAPIQAIRDFTGRVEVDLLFSMLPTGELCPS
jgi:FMN phosphatase YigB (HAD superfamily)